MIKISTYLHMHTKYMFSDRAIFDRLLHVHRPLDMWGPILAYLLLSNNISNMSMLTKFINKFTEWQGRIIPCPGKWAGGLIVELGLFHL